MARPQGSRAGLDSERLGASGPERAGRGERLGVSERLAVSDPERPGVSDSERLGPGVSRAHPGSEPAPLPSAASVLCAPKRRREDGGSDGGGADGGGDGAASVTPSPRGFVSDSESASDPG